MVRLNKVAVSLILAFIDFDSTIIFELLFINIYYHYDNSFSYENKAKYNRVLFETDFSRHTLPNLDIL